MMLHGDGSSSIYYENCFSALPRFRNIYDRVLMNPPFAQKDSELKFVYETLRNMKEGGILASVLPKSCVKGTERRNVGYLEQIFALSSLKAVISLPNNLFYPVGANTCIVIFKKSKSENNETLLINALDDGFLVLNETRVDVHSRWEGIKDEILRAYLYGVFDEFRAIIKENLKPSDELLFEVLHRPVDIERDVFARYIRENIAAKVLCNRPLKSTPLKIKKLKSHAYERFLISDLIEKVANGNEKSIQRTLEDKYDLNGIPTYHC